MNISDMRKFEFNCVYVIESLCADDRKTGTELYEDRLRWASLKSPYLSTKLIHVQNKSEFASALTDILTKSNQNHYPLIHFEIHGSKKGIVLQSGELVNWKELCGLTREINVVIKNNLFVSFATCYSAGIWSAVAPYMPAPFFGFIGSWQKIYDSDIMEDFTMFFEELVLDRTTDRTDLNEAFRRCNQKTNKYVLYLGEQIFNRAWADYNTQLKDREKTQKRINTIHSNVLSSRTRPMPKKNKRNLLKQITHKMIDQNPQTWQKWKALFLMEHQQP